MKTLKWALAAMTAILLVACGGGGSAGTPPFGPGSGTDGTGTTPGSTLLVSISSTTPTAAAPSTVTATLTSSSGSAIAGQVVTFTTVGDLGAFSPNTALTDSSGQATVQLTPKTASVNGADLVLARVTSGTTTVSGTIGFQVSPSDTPITGGGPSISLSLSSASITSAAPATLTAVVKNAAGVILPGQVVKFTTAGTGIGSFSVASALTDATGTATTRINPASSSSNGADLAIAQATVGTTLVTSSVGFSVTSTGSSVGTPSITLALSTSSVTTATPATITALVRDATGAGVVGQVVKFRTVDGLGALAVTSALTDNTGSASTTLTASSATQSGADQVIATTTVNGTALQASQGFQLTAASVAIASVTPDIANLGPYGQTNVHVALSGTIAGTPVVVSITSACLASGKATLTPATATTTTAVADFTYRDAGCGATTASDTLRASVAGSGSTGSLVIAIQSPTATSINFISASPSSIFLKGSGFVETSTIAFRVLDNAGNGLPNQSVSLTATTFAGGLTLDDGSVPVTRLSDNLGNVIVRINSGTVPTPVRVTASLVDNPATAPNESLITTVSSSLAIAVGLPSQLNFSLSQGTKNIEGGNIDGVANTYNIIASDRLGNPVPAGTAVNFVTEGGQVEAIKQTSIDATGNARATANFLSSSPRPADGRITVVAYALGEESFLDQNGNNIWDGSEPFQDLGSLYLDRVYNGHYNRDVDQFIALSLPGATTASCVRPESLPPPANQLLGFDTSIPSIPSVDPSYPGFLPPPVPTSCDATWGKAYVRRAIQTVLSTSEARPLWFAAPSNLHQLNSGVACSAVLLTDGGYDADQNPVARTYPVFAGGDSILYNATGTYSILVADANPVRLNPMAAGTTITIAGTTGLDVKFLGGSPVPSTTEATFATFSVGFGAASSGTVTLIFTSPRGLATSVTMPVVSGAPPPGSIQCP